MTFSFIHFSDHHLGSSKNDLIKGIPTAERFEKVLQHINANHPDIDFLISSGDITGLNNQDSYAFISKFLGIEKAPLLNKPAKINSCGLKNMPIYCLPGNNDDRSMFYETFFTCSPQPRMDLFFDYKNIRIIFIDWGEDARAVSTSNTYNFLNDAMNTQLPILIFMHHSIVPIGCSWLDSLLPEDCELFSQKIQNKGVKGVFCGHLHNTYEIRSGEVPVYGIRSTAFQFPRKSEPAISPDAPHYRLVKVDQGNITTSVIEVPV
ncbi:MAG: metallophosphoesterase [Anaerolineaceae bacterium]|nr:metallophosphoesterase [Anaerolineaceae bacterium]